MFHQPQNFSPATFLTLTKTLRTHGTRTTSAKVSLTPPTNPRTNTTHATHTIYQTRKTNLNGNNNGLITAELHHRYSPEHIRDFENLFWMLASKFISKEKKHFQSLQYTHFFL